MDTMRELLATALADGSLSGSGAVVLVSRDGVDVASVAVGTTAHPAPDRRAADSWPEPVPVTVATRFDIASLTKLFVAATLLTELADRSLDAHLPVAEVLPEFRDSASARITVADLLSHTAGFAAEWRPVGTTTPAQAWAQFRSTRPLDPPGERYRYSCVGYIWAGLVVEELTGGSLDKAIATRLTEPLGLAHTGFRPGASDRGDIAATEIQPGRGLVHGEVHDEAAWALGGIAGNAGLFATAGDMLRFAEVLRCGGTLEGRRMLPADVVDAMTSERVDAGEHGQALGPRIDERWMCARPGSRRIGHTGFTGTSLSTDPGGNRSIVFLSNRVHPSRVGADIGAMRTAVSRTADEIVGDSA